MRFVSGSLVLMLLTLSCSSSPKEDIAPASFQETARMADASRRDCTDDSFCTREYLPTTCQFNGKSFDGSNPCEARKVVRRYACENNLTFVDADVQCKPKEERSKEKAQ